MKTNTGDKPPPAWTATCADTEIEALVGFWLDAAAHRWSLTVGQYVATWAVCSEDQMAGAGYAPPDEVGNGRVNAFDVGRTLARTGVASQAEAVEIIRDFFGWQPDGGQPDPRAFPVLPTSATTRLAGLT